MSWFISTRAGLRVFPPFGIPAELECSWFLFCFFFFRLKVNFFILSKGHLIVKSLVLTEIIQALENLCIKAQQTLLSLHRWFYFLWYCITVFDGQTGGSFFRKRTEQNKKMVYNEATEWLPWTTQQACRHLLFLLGGSNIEGSVQNRCRDSY